MPVILVQEKSRFNRYIYNLNSTCKDNFQFYSDIDEYDSLVTLAPLEPLSLLWTYRTNGQMITILDGVFDLSNALKNTKHKYPLHIPSVNNYILCLGNHERDLIKRLNPEVYVCSYKPKFIDDIANDNSSVEIMFDFLITTANSSYFDDDEYQGLITLLLETVSELDKSSFTYILRIFDERILKDLRDSGCKAENFIDGDFKSILKKVDAILTSPSTISVESMAFNRPTGTFYYRDEPLLTQTGWIIHRGVNMSRVFNEMKVRDPNKMIIQKALLDNYLKVDFETLTPDILDGFKKLNVKSEIIESESAKLLNSKYNFNIKYFLKKIYIKLRQRYYE